MISDKKLLKKISLNRQSKVIDAIKVMTEIGIQLIIVVDDKKLFLGVLNDYDLRLSFLKGKNLDSEIAEIYNKKTFFLKKKFNTENALNLLKEKKLEHIPILNNKRLIGIFVDDRYFTESKIKKGINTPIVIMSGGYGKRIGKLTKNYPKGMLCVNKKPLLEQIINNAKNLGFKNFILSVSFKKEIIKKYFGDGKKFDIHIKYLEEKSEMGTIGSVRLLKNEKNNNLIVVNCDVITKANIAKMLVQHDKKKSFATIGIKSFSYSNPYGVIKSSRGKLVSLEEKPKINFNINAGIYVFNKKIVKIIKDNDIKDTNDLINLLSKKKYNISLFPIYEEWIDYGKFSKKLKRLKIG